MRKFVLLFIVSMLLAVNVSYGDTIAFFDYASDLSVTSSHSSATVSQWKEASGFANRISLSSGEMRISPKNGNAESIWTDKYFGYFDVDISTGTVSLDSFAVDIYPHDGWGIWYLGFSTSMYNDSSDAWINGDTNYLYNIGLSGGQDTTVVVD